MAGIASPRTVIPGEALKNHSKTRHLPRSAPCLVPASSRCSDAVIVDLIWQSIRLRFNPSSLLAKLTTAAIATARIIAPRAIALVNHLSLNIDQASSPNIALQAAILHSATTLRSCPPRMPGTLTVDNLIYSDVAVSRVARNNRFVSLGNNRNAA